MIDYISVGNRISNLRKQNKLTQDELAEKLGITAQAISKWENGHALPETSLLPVLAQIFGCTIDDIIMPAYLFDEEIELEKPADLEQQAEHIAEIVIKKIGDNMKNANIGLDEQEIIDAVNLDANYFKGNAVMEIITGMNKNNENGRIYLENLRSVLKYTAQFHAVRWINKPFTYTLDWRLQSKENVLFHISGMEKEFKKYRKNYKPGEVWIGHTDNISDEQLDYFNKATEYLKSEYANYIDERFAAGKNITVINGELEPVQTYMALSDDRTVKIVPQGVRVGLCTENLAELLALHIEPDRKKAEPLLKYYHDCLSEKVENYPYEMFISDYKLSIAEYMFKPIRLANHGINDFLMRDRAIKAFETFMLN